MWAYAPHTTNFGVNERRFLHLYPQFSTSCDVTEKATISFVEETIIVFALHEIRTPLLCGEDEDEGIDTGSMILWLS